ncbi:MAG TPA: HemK2/MTQ2 family protein methyltransferase [Natrialbaceae archaeon]|nr:HemK2/MTQ2 family protein methyltransferase [Natrialbaceae archaeon]
MDLADRRGIERDVYQPAEDSALLADVAASVVGPDDLVLDVGTGSGFVAGRIAEETGARVIGSDLNPHACRRARERGVPVVRGNLTEPFVDGAFDVVTFNPPYLPTDPETEWDDWMEVALSGGETGLAVVEPFLASVGRVLAPDGVVLLLASSLAGVEAVVELAVDGGFSAVALRDDSYPFETLTVLKLIQTDA